MLQFVLQKEPETLNEFENYDFLINYFKEIGYDGKSSFIINITDIEVLADRCELVLDDLTVAPTILPTNEAYDDYYLEKVRDVYDFIIDDLFPLLDEKSPDEHIYLKNDN